VNEFNFVSHELADIWNQVIRDYLPVESILTCRQVCRGLLGIYPLPYARIEFPVNLKDEATLKRIFSSTQRFIFTGAKLETSSNVAEFVDTWIANIETSSVNSLRFHGCEIDDSVAKTFVKLFQHLKQLEVLDLESDVWFGSQNCVEILQSLSTHGVLRHISAPFDDSALSMFTSILPKLKNLQIIHVLPMSITPVCIQSFFDAATSHCISTLQRLDFSVETQSLDYSRVSSLLSSSATLQSLRIGALDCSFEALADGVRATRSLKDLTIWPMLNATDTCLELFGAALHANSTIENLTINFGGASIEKMLSQLVQSSIKSLILYRSYLYMPNVNVSLVDFLAKNKSLTCLKLTDVLIFDSSAFLAAVGSASSNITELVLWSEFVSAPSNQALAALAASTSLQKLDIRTAFLPDDVSTFASALQHQPNSTLTDLTLAACGIELYSAMAIGDLLQSPDCRIQRLSLAENPFEEGCIDIVFEAFQSNSSVSYLDVSECNCTMSNFEYLAKSLSGGNVTLLEVQLGYDAPLEAMDLLISAAQSRPPSLYTFLSKR
jgi:hypothetical protein